MIDYETLCQHISDWRAGNKPGLPPPLPGGVVAAPAYEEEQPLYEEQAASSEGYEEALPVYDEYEELQPDAELEVAESESEQTQSELPASGYEELDTTLEESGGAEHAARSALPRDPHREGPPRPRRTYARRRRLIRPSAPPPRYA